MGALEVVVGALGVVVGEGAAIKTKVHLQVG